MGALIFNLLTLLRYQDRSDSFARGQLRIKSSFIVPSNILTWTYHEGGGGSAMGAPGGRPPEQNMLRIVIICSQIAPKQ